LTDETYEYEKVLLKVVGGQVTAASESTLSLIPALT